jgi:predicted nucleic acid-binding Zn ribbon protein
MNERGDRQACSLIQAGTFCFHWCSEEIGEVVEETIRAFRRHRMNPSELAWQDYVEANRAKGAAIRQAKRQCSKEVIEIACKEGGKSFWRLMG